MTLNRQQLPPQIRKLAVVERATGKPGIRYEVVVDVGVNPVSGERRQARRRYRTEAEARAGLTELQAKAQAGAFVSRSALTVDRVCADYVAGRHNLRDSSRSKLEYDLAPLRERFGKLPVQRLVKADVDALVTDLCKGGTITAKGRVRRPWSPIAVNKFVGAVDQVLADAYRQRIVAANVAADVARVSAPQVDLDTFSVAEVEQLRTYFATDRLGHAWELALHGLRRGEIAGLKWSSIDFTAATLSIVSNRVSAGGVTVQNDPKSAASRRMLPLSDRLAGVLRAAKARQAAERLAIGEHYRGGEFVVSNEIGDAYSPAVLSRYWAQALSRAGVRHLKLHGARHTAATLMHLDGVPIAVIAAWIGHDDPSFTLRVYAHSPAESLKAAASVLDRPGASSG